VVDEAVDRGRRHRLIAKESPPLAERLIGCDENRPPLVTRRDQLEQDASVGLILGDVDDVVEDEQVVAVKLGDRGLEHQLVSPWRRGGDLMPKRVSVSGHSLLNLLI
jgi:hypothetical protein